MTLQELREKREGIVAEMVKLRDKAADSEQEWTAEDEQAWAAANKDYDTVCRQIQMAERVAEIEASREERVDDGGVVGRSIPVREPEKRDRRAPTTEDYTVALQAWSRARTGLDLTDEHREAVERCRVNLASDYFDVRLDMRPNSQRVAEFRALSASTGSAGAYTIPEGFMPQLETALLAYGPMRQVADVIRTSGGETMPWPTTNDTGNTGSLLAENTAVSTTDPSFGVVNLGAYKFSSDLVKVPFELLQDSAFDMAAVLSTMLGERIARGQNAYFTTGTGSSQPQGIVTGATLGVTAASATAIAWTELDDLIHSVDPAYRPQSAFMMHDNVALALRKLTDGEGRPVWAPAPNGALPDNLKGYPWYINQDMASSIATTNKTIIFGALKKYKIRDVATIRLYQLKERYADYDQVAYIAFMRSDGALLDAGTHPVKYLQQA